MRSREQPNALIWKLLTNFFLIPQPKLVQYATMPNRRLIDFRHSRIHSRIGGRSGQEEVLFLLILRLYFWTRLESTVDWTELSLLRNLNTRPSLAFPHRPRGLHGCKNLLLPPRADDEFPPPRGVCWEPLDCNTVYSI